MTDELRAWALRAGRLAAGGTPYFFLLDFELGMPRLWTLPEAANAGLRFSFPGRPDEESGAPPAVGLSVGTLERQRYERAFEMVQRGLQHGDSFLTNLTFPVPVVPEGSLAEIYAATEAKYRVLLPDQFVCFSPETFVTVGESGYIETYPMKGTAPDTPAGRAWLLHDPKEIAEHATIVDLMRNDLSRVAREVRVTDYRYIRAIERRSGGLLQSSSRIGGRLAGDWRANLGDWLLELLPAGSVSGAPKPATLELIRRAEGAPRGYYCGIAGYFDGSTLDSCVLIRLLERSGSSHFFRAGGGITARSRVGEEYAELMAKVRLPLRQSV